MESPGRNVADEPVPRLWLAGTHLLFGTAAKAGQPPIQNLVVNPFRRTESHLAEIIDAGHYQPYQANYCQYSSPPRREETETPR